MKQAVRGFAPRKWFMRALSCALMAAMLLTMLPASLLAVSAAEETTAPVIVKQEDGTYDVTFSYKPDGTPQEVALRGSIPGITWDNTVVEEISKLKDEDGDGIWTVTLTGLPTGNYDYQYLTKTDGSDFQWTDTGNRPLRLNEKLVIVPHEDDNSVSDVTLRLAEPDFIDDKGHKISEFVDGQENPVTGPITSVKLAGDMNDWSEEALTRTAPGSNIWEITLLNVAAKSYGYKFVVHDANDNAHWQANYSATEQNHPLTVKVRPEYESPVVNGKEVTFRLWQAVDPDTVCLASDMNEWDTSGKNSLTLGEDGMWSLTLPLEAGKYQYQFVVDGTTWIEDSENPWPKEGANNVVFVPGLAGASLSVEKGESAALPETLNLFAEDGTSQAVTPTYSINSPVPGVTLEGTTLTVAEDCEAKSVAVKAEAEGQEATITVQIIDPNQLYTYNVYYYDYDASHMTLDDTEIYFWTSTTAAAEFPFTETVDINGKTWLKGTVTSTDTTSLGFIVRHKGDWDWQTKPDYIFDNSDLAETLDIYMAYDQANNNLVTSLGEPPEIPDQPVEQPRTFFVPGTFPGPSWDAASNKMEFDAEKQVYFKTFEDVPPANYEFKISVKGSWDENYGANGVQGGANISVTVPKQMDVTVYYSDVTHYAVTNVTYEFLDIDLTGTGFESTKLTDPGLTGIFSATVTLQPGTYSDAKFTSSNGAAGTFGEFTLTEEKTVTFYYAPLYNVYYCDASPWEEIDVLYDSKDETYKNPYGAVPSGTNVSFAVDVTAAGSVTGVTLVVGSEQFELSRVSGAAFGMQRWKTDTVNIANIGEYDYFFLIKQTGGIMVYGDDDGFYGTGKLSDLGAVQPYDLVVYENGFTTPDWMKNAVIYQIFPDRFSNGDAKNDRAQEESRGAIMYEFAADKGGWNLLPENPEQYEADPEHYPEDAFKGDGNWSNEIYGGDLKGITQKIGYLKQLGVTVIYLNPVFKSISSHRYDASDYRQIDPILGTLGDFTELVKTAEENGMKIVLDGVFNHVSDDSIYFDRYYKYLKDADGDGNYDTDTVGAYPYWAYVYDYKAEHATGDNEADLQAAIQAANEYFSSKGITNFEYTEWFDIFETPMDGAVTDTIGERAGKPVYGYDGWWGYDSMPIIKATNGSEYQTGTWADKIIGTEESTDAVSQYWLNQGSNGWRLDVANEVSDETWRHFRDVVKATQSDAVIIGEIWDDATKYLMGDMYDSVMNYQFRNAVTAYAMGGSSVDSMNTLERLRERYPQEAFYAMMNLVGSHDTTRILSYLDGIPDDRTDATMDTAFPRYDDTSDLAKKRQYLVAFLQFTYAGAPTIYYGDERGLVGSDDPDDRRTIDWNTVNDADLLEWYQLLAKVRSQFGALRTGTVEPIETGNNAVLGYVRRDGDDAIIVLANNSEKEQIVTLKMTDLAIRSIHFTDLLGSGVEASVDVNGNITVTVPAIGGVILDDDQKVIAGDLDADGEVDILDAYRTYKAASGSINLYGLEETLADVNEDGTVDMVDVFTVYLMAKGQSVQTQPSEPEPPAEPQQPASVPEAADPTNRKRAA